jgi:hypothetical protein
MRVFKIVTVCLFSVCTQAVASASPWYTVDEIVQFYSENSAAAQKEFEAKTIYISGVVGSVSQGLSGGQVLNISAFNLNQSLPVRCQLTAAGTKKAAALKIGEDVFVKASLLGPSILALNAKDCDISGGSNVVQNKKTSQKSVQMDLPAPLELSWETTTPTIAKEFLSKRLEFVGQKTRSEQEIMGDLLLGFRGKFAGLESDKIELEFVKDKLIGASIMFSGLPFLKDTQEKIINMMREKYGEAMLASNEERMSMWVFKDRSIIIVQAFKDKIGWLYLNKLDELEKIKQERKQKEDEEKKLSEEAAKKEASKDF